jgi:hypothetical protein
MALLPTGGFNYTHLAANGSTNAIKSGIGILHALTINTKGSAANTITIYDSLTAGSGTVIAQFDSTTLIQCFILDAIFLVGLSVTVATGTAGDYTMTWL